MPFSIDILKDIHKTKRVFWIGGTGIVLLVSLLVYLFLTREISEWYTTSVSSFSIDSENRLYLDFVGSMGHTFKMNGSIGMRDFTTVYEREGRGIYSYSIEYEKRSGRRIAIDFAKFRNYMERNEVEGSVLMEEDDDRCGMSLSGHIPLWENVPFGHEIMCEIEIEQQHNAFILHPVFKDRIDITFFDFQLNGEEVFPEVELFNRKDKTANTFNLHHGESGYRETLELSEGVYSIIVTVDLGRFGILSGRKDKVPVK